MKIERILFRDYSAESAIFMRRVLIAFAGIVLLTGFLIVNLYYLQIICFKEYSTRSNENRIRLLPILPNRGIIYDRNGIPLALNRTIYNLELIPNKVNHLSKTIESLRSIVDLTDKDIEHFENRRKISNYFTSLPIKIGLSDIQQARFAVNQFKFPGVEIKSYQRRYYPYGSLLPHVVGYVSKINDQDIKRLRKEGMFNNYSSTEHIGKLGIERYYESTLHGKIGYKTVEVNNYGKIIRQLHKKLPTSGKDITLTLDINLQKYIKLLISESRAAVVVVDPRDGGIIALVSNPSYDPNLFVTGISKNDFHRLLEDKNKPLINRTIQGIYPPASTVKPYISVSALSIGIINKNFSLFDPGWWKIPGYERRYRDWKRWGHGQLNLTKALEESADTFFYQIAHDMGIDRLSEWMIKFGYGKSTGIDLSEEKIGIMPTRDWKMKKYKKPWYQGDTIPVGIGQGYWTATPLQMSKALMTLINNGSVRIPHLLNSIYENERSISYSPPKSNQIGDPSSSFWKMAKDGMFGVANRPNGTAHKNFLNAPYKAAVKSGTAQIYNLKDNETYNAENISERLRDHKLMISFAPYENPTVATVVILENGGVGSSVGTITRQILDYILIKKKYN